jgi:phenylalanyl-tRNA synthetase beta chain
MVYVYSKLSKLNKYLDKKLSINEIEESLIDMGLDLKGVSKEDDPELKIELTAEKLDMISVVGIARAINYFKGFRDKIPKYELSKGNNRIIVEESVSIIRPRTVAMIVKGLKIDEETLEEIIEIQEKIHQSFGRNRKKAAIGIYPLNKIKFPIYYRAENPKDINFRALELEEELTGDEILEKHETGKKYSHLLKGKEKYPIFIDSNNNILSMPPIINSHDTGRVNIGDSELFVEVSGHNLSHLDNILKVLATTFIEMDANIETIKVEYPNNEKYELDLNNSYETFNLDYAEKLIGINISKEELPKLLIKMMYELKEINGDEVRVEIPVYKSDVWNDCDVADDLARAYGYNNIVPKLPKVSSIASKLPLSYWIDEQIKLMVGLGFLELYTYMLSSSKVHFDNMLLDSSNEDYIKLLDSEEQGLNMVRKMILPDNLNALLVNRKNKYPQKIFEIGFVIEPNEKEETKAKDCYHLTASIASPDSNYTQIKEIFDTFAKLNQLDFEFKRSNLAYLIEGRGAEIYFKGEKVGFIGELSPYVLENFSLLVPVSSFEIDLEKIYFLKNN